VMVIHANDKVMVVETMPKSSLHIVHLHPTLKDHKIISNQPL